MAKFPKTYKSYPTAVGPKPLALVRSWHPRPRTQVHPRGVVLHSFPCTTRRTLVD